MSDLGLAVDYSSVLEAIKATTNLEDSWARMVQGVIAEERRLAAMAKASDQQVEEGFMRMTKKVEDQAQRHYDALVTKRMRFQNRMDAQRNKEEVAAFASMRREAEEENRNIDRIAAEKQRAVDEEIAANAKAKASYLQLAGRYDPLIRGANEFAKAQDQLQDALQRDIITLDQYYNQLKKVEVANLSGAGDFTQFGAKALVSGKNLGYFGMVTQQAGYQLQDFFVQIQGGTSPLVALGQQGSQMAGIFGPGGAVVGALLAVGTALAGVLIGTMDFGKSFEDMAKEVSEAMGDLESSTGRLEKAFQQDLASAISVATGELSSFLDKWNEIETKAFVDAFKPIREDLTGPLDDAGKYTETYDLFGGVRETNTLKEAGVEDVGSARELAAIYKTLESDTIPGLVGKFVEANTLIERSVELSDKEKEAAQEKLVSIAKEIGIADQLNSIQSQGAEDRKAWLEQLAEIEATTASTKLYFIDQERAYWQSYSDAQVAKSQAMAKLHQEEADKEDERLRKAYEYYADSREAGEALARVDLATALAGATTNADGLANAMIKALGAAESIRKMFSWGPTTTYGEVFQGPSDDPVYRAEQNRLKDLGSPPRFEDPDLDGLPGVTPDAKKGGGGSKKTGGDRLAQLEQEYQQKLKIAKLSGEQLEYEQTYQAVVKALGDDQSKYSEDFIKQKTAELAEVQKLIDLENDRKDLLKSVEGAFEDMFMSMADGTKSVKDAFTDMARSIVAELWKVLVVKQAVNAVSGFIGGIGSGNLGGTPSNSVVSVNDAVISPSGQIISTSPEDFLIATKKPQNLANSLGGNGNSNTVSEGAVTVNQTFQISGSDQATVQQALVRAMPAIVTATKSAIVDSRRRGSSDLRGSF